jgi:plastocyanin
MTRAWSRFGGLLVGILILGLLVPGQATGSTGGASQPYSYHGPVPLPDNGIMFGAYVPPDPHNGPDRRTALTNYEAMIGRTLAVERVYVLWNEAWPTADDLWSRDQGHTLYMSWNASPDDGSGCRRWADIAAGVYDADIDARALDIIGFGAPMFFSFHHEPTTAPPNHIACGTPQEYQAAWRHIHDRFVADGVTNVTYSITYTAQNFDKNKAKDFYPGDDIIDTVAADGYNWYGCPFHPGPWREMSEIFNSFYQFGVAHNKPLIIAEYGTGEDPADPGAKAQWFTNGADQLKKWPLIKGVSYFNVGNGGTCDRYVDSSTNSLQAFSANGADPYFNPPVTTTDVSITDFAFTPNTVTVPQGSVVSWTNDGPSVHTVTARKMNLFDSDDMAVGSTFAWVFTQAGTYSYKCKIHPSMTGAVKVAPTADPTSGNETTVFTIGWSANFAPDGFRYDVQIKRPGGIWENWKMSQTSMEGSFLPDAGTGPYSFRARYKDQTTGATSGWSPAVKIVVS